MKGFTALMGIAIPLGLNNVDTDMILPGRHLKVITRVGLGRYAFEPLRDDQPNNIFDSPRHSGAPILIAGDNFGCGSSREHAAWALADMGVRAIIAPLFADIFSSNAFKNGILLIELPNEQVEQLLSEAGDGDVSIDLEHQTVTAPHGDRFSFAYDPFRKSCLIDGLDEIGLTERSMDDIDRFAATRFGAHPWIANAARRAA